MLVFEATDLSVRSANRSIYSPKKLVTAGSQDRNIWQHPTVLETLDDCNKRPKDNNSKRRDRRKNKQRQQHHQPTQRRNKELTVVKLRRSKLTNTIGWQISVFECPLGKRADNFLFGGISD